MSKSELKLHIESGPVGPHNPHCYHVPFLSQRISSRGNIRQKYRRLEDVDDAALIQFWHQTLHGLHRINSLSIRKSATAFLNSRYCLYMREDSLSFHELFVMQRLQNLLLCHRDVVIDALIKNMGVVLNDKTFANFHTVYAFFGRMVATDHMPAGKHEHCMNTEEEEPGFKHVELPQISGWRRWAPLTIRLRPSQEITSMPPLVFQKLPLEETREQPLTPISRFGIEDDLCLLRNWIDAMQEYRRGLGLQFEAQAAEKLNAFDRPNASLFHAHEVHHRLLQILVDYQKVLSTATAARGAEGVLLKHCTFIHFGTAFRCLGGRSVVIEEVSWDQSLTEGVLGEDAEKWRQRDLYRSDRKRSACQMSSMTTVRQLLQQERRTRAKKGRRHSDYHGTETTNSIESQEGDLETTSRDGESGGDDRKGPI